MEAQLLCCPSGKILFMEVNSEFVDVLIKLLNAPMGSIIGVASQDPEDDEGGAVALGGMVASVSRLRPALFHGKAQDLLPTPLELEDVHACAIAGEEAKPKAEEPDKCVMCLKYGGFQQQLQCHAQHLPGTCNQCRQPTAKRCPTMGVGPCCRDTFLTQQLASYQHCVACGSSGRAGVTNQNKPCIHCGKKKKPRVCNSCSMCDACGIATAGYTVVGVTDAVKVKQLKPSRMVKETVKFLVTNTLDVFENSSVKAFELIAAHVQGLQGIHPRTVVVTPEHLRAMLRHALLGSTAILDNMFAAGVADDSASVSTDKSFDLVFNAEDGVTSGKTGKKKSSSRQKAPGA